MSLPETVTIRPMEEPDLDTILAIEQMSFSLPWCREHFLHEIAARHSFPFVAELDGAIVGYVCLRSLFEEAQILDIAVDPLQRGRGIALQLMERAFITALEQRAEIMALEVRVSNVAAISLYEQFGFSRTGLRPRYYQDGEDAVLMEKRLAEQA